MRKSISAGGRFGAVAALLLLVAWTTAARSRQTTGDLSPNLKPLAFLLGSCWRGTFADGKTTDVRCYEPVFGGKFVRERHVVRGLQASEYRGESLYHWDGEAKQIRFTYWNSSGGVSTGAMLVDGTRRVFPTERYKGADGRTREFKTTWHVMGDTAWVMVTEEQKAGEAREWVEAWRVSFVRDALARLPE